MALADLIGLIFGPRLKLPRDHVTRPSRRATKAAKPSIDAMQAALDKISGLPGIADVKQTKRLPRGFSEAMQELRTAYDQYFETVRKFLPGGLEAKRPGEPFAKLRRGIGEGVIPQHRQGELANTIGLAP